MTATISKPAHNLREDLAVLAAKVALSRQETFWFTGNASTTTFSLPKGWKPKQIFVSGALKRPGSGWDYTVASDGFVYTVTFAVAPSAVSIGIIAELEVRT